MMSDLEVYEKIEEFLRDDRLTIRETLVEIGVLLADWS